jgi:hypothetical protein
MAQNSATTNELNAVAHTHGLFSSLGLKIKTAAGKEEMCKRIDAW